MSEVREPEPSEPRGRSPRAWLDLGAEALRRGEFRRALELYTRARQAAEALGDAEAVDTAEVNLAATHLQQGEARRGIEGLREILLRSAAPETRFRAAYHLASGLRRLGQHERALRYAERAERIARDIGADDLLASAHNLLGNLYLVQNYPHEAIAAYERALALWRRIPGDHRFSEAIVRDNLGYCRLVLQQVSAGVREIRRALRLADAVGDRRCRGECMQDLCYAYLLAGRFERARAYGTAGLEIARDAGYSDLEENCHFLLGELGNRTGDHELRDEHFDALQRAHPELPFLKDFLSSVDVTRVITLKR